MERRQRLQRAIQSLESYLAELPQQFLVEQVEGELLGVEGMYSSAMDLTLRSNGWNPVWRPTEKDGQFFQHWRAALRDLLELGLFDEAKVRRGWLPNEIEAERLLEKLESTFEESPESSRSPGEIEKGKTPNEPHPKDVAQHLPIKERRAFDYQRMLRAMADAEDPKDQVLPDGTRVTKPLTMAHYEALWASFQKSSKPTQYGSKPSS